MIKTAVPTATGLEANEHPRVDWVADLEARRFGGAPASPGARLVLRRAP